MMAKMQTLPEAAGLFVDGDWVESKDQDPMGEIRLIQLADAMQNASGEHLEREKSLELSTSTLARLRSTN